MERLKAVLLVGGLGTRLRPLTNDRPKSIMPVLNRPVLEHTLAYLKRYNVRDIIITLNYLPDVIKNYFKDGRDYGVNLVYCMEEQPRGTAGAVKNVESYLDGPFFVLNGDVFSNLDLAAMYDFHRQKRAQATIALTYVENPSAFGVVATDDTGRVQQFIEKPPPGQAVTHWINAGTYILEPDVLQEIPPACNFMFEKGLYPRLLEIGKPVYGYKYQGYWLDMGKPEHYYTINMDLMNSKFSSLLKIDSHKPVLNKKAVNIHSSAEIHAPALIGDGSTISEGVKLIGSVILGKDCRIGDGTVVEKSIIWDDVSIGANSKIKECIIASGTVIGENQSLERMVVTPGQSVPLAI